MYNCTMFHGTCLFAFVYSLQLVTCFFEVCGMLVDVFWAIVYLRPLRRHYYKSMRFHALIEVIAYGDIG